MDPHCQSNPPQRPSILTRGRKEYPLVSVHDIRESSYKLTRSKSGERRGRHSLSRKEKIVVVRKGRGREQGEGKDEVGDVGEMRESLLRMIEHQERTLAEMNSQPMAPLKPQEMAELLTDLKGACLIFSCFKHKPQISQSLLSIFATLRQLTQHLSPTTSQLPRHFASNKSSKMLVELHPDPVHLPVNDPHLEAKKIGYILEEESPWSGVGKEAESRVSHGSERNGQEGLRDVTYGVNNIHSESEEKSGSGREAEEGGRVFMRTIVKKALRKDSKAPLQDHQPATVKKSDFQSNTLAKTPRAATPSSSSLNSTDKHRQSLNDTIQLLNTKYLTHPFPMR